MKHINLILLSMSLISFGYARADTLTADTWVAGVLFKANTDLTLGCTDRTPVKGTLANIYTSRDIAWGAAGGTAETTFDCTRNVLSGYPEGSVNVKPYSIKSRTYVALYPNGKLRYFTLAADTTTKDGIYTLKTGDGSQGSPIVSLYENGSIANATLSQPVNLRSPYTQTAVLPIAAGSISFYPTQGATEDIMAGAPRIFQTASNLIINNIIIPQSSWLYLTADQQIFRVSSPARITVGDIILPAGGDIQFLPELAYTVRSDKDWSFKGKSYPGGKLYFIFGQSVVPSY